MERQRLRNRSNVGFHSCLCFAFAFAFASVSSDSFVGALLTSFLSSISFATRPFINSFFHDATSLIRLVLSCRLPCRHCTQAMRSHTRRRVTCRCSCPDQLCVVFVSCVPTFPKSIGTGPSSAIISLMMIFSFSVISSQFLGPSVLRQSL